MVRIVIAALALLAGGCLAPQDIDEAEPSGALENHAPRIVPDQALVHDLPVTRIYVQSSCDSIDFEVKAVEDEDLDDDLEVRFFVDYDGGCPDCRGIRKRVWARSTPDTRELRTVDAAFVLQLPLDEGTHLVEAWVSDGFSSDAAAQPENQAVLEGKGVDKVVWVVEVRNAENQECLPVAGT